MPKSRGLRRFLVAVPVLSTLAVIGVLIDAWPAFGTAPTGARRVAMEASPQWGTRTFVNPQAMTNHVWDSITSMMSASAYAEPDSALPVVRGDGGVFATPPASGLRVTWLGHSTQVIELDGVRVLTDPIFGGRASPVNWAGPETWYAPPIPLDALPSVDAVFISHDHYDHLQMETMQAMAAWDTTFIVPLGVGAHLEGWGVPAERIVEMDWWDTHMLGAVQVVATPSRHASGRQVLDQNRTLWMGVALIGPAHRAYYSGDTGLFPAMNDIGERLGPFDVTMIEVGAYNAAWPDWHLGPEQALRAHEMVRGDVFMPVHWGLMNLSTHGWTEPAERVMVEAARRGVTAYVPRPGEGVQPSLLPEQTRWWPSLPWDTVAEAPIEATLVPPEPARESNSALHAEPSEASDAP